MFQRAVTVRLSARRPSEAALTLDKAHYAVLKLKKPRLGNRVGLGISGTCTHRYCPYLGPKWPNLKIAVA